MTDKFFLPPKITGPLNNTTYRYVVFVSGRGCAKTWSIARWLLATGAQRKIFVGCFREWMNSIKESNHRVLKTQIELMGLSDFYEVGRDIITGVNGTEFAFAGLRTDPRKVKGMEGMDFAWVDEAAKVPKDSWDLLTPTLFRKKGARLLVSFNPEEEDDPSSEMFITNPRPGAVLVRLTQDDNPFLTDDMKAEMAHAYSVDPENAAHVWGGQFRTISDAQIFRGKYVVEDFTPGGDWVNGPYYGMDFGMRDPTVVMKCWIFERKLYIEHEAWGQNCDITERARLVQSVPGAYLTYRLPGSGTVIAAPRQPVIQCDCSDPLTIQHLNQFGINAKPVRKVAGSIEARIVYLKGFDKIVIHPRCVKMEEEARLYRYKVDRLSGEVQSTIVDKYNHCWDAIGYALEPIINNEREVFMVYDGLSCMTVSPQLEEFDSAMERAGF